MQTENPTDRALVAPREGRIARSWRLVRAALALLRSDGTMVALAAIATVASLAGMAAIFLAAGFFHDPNSTRVWIAVLICAYPLTFIGVFLNVALVAAAQASLEGGHLTLTQALAAAGRRAGPIAVWALLQVGVGTLLQTLADRLPAGGRIASWLLGTAWTIATIFVVPVLVIEGRGPVQSLKRSAGLVRERWGEGLSGTLAISACLIVVVFPAALLIGAGAALISSTPVAGVPLIVVGAAVILGTIMVGTATRELFALVLYRYAIDSVPRAGFTASDLDNPIRPRHGGSVGR